MVLVLAVQPVIIVDVDANVYADVDDDVILVVNMVTVVQNLSQHDPKIDYPIHVVINLLDQLFKQKKKNVFCFPFKNISKNNETKEEIPIDKHTLTFTGLK